MTEGSRLLKPVFVATALLLLGHLASPGHPPAPAAAAEPPPSGLRPIAHLGGASRAIEIRGGHAFLGVGRRVTVLDMSDPRAPREVGRTPLLDGTVYEIVLAGDLAYLALTNGLRSSLAVLDIRAPAAPKILGQVDVAKPDVPCPGGLVDIAVDGTRVYGAAYAAGLYVFDAADPRAPRLAATVPTESGAVAVGLDGGRAYVSLEAVAYRQHGETVGNPGVRVFDLAEPLAPASLGILNETLDTAHGVVEGLAVAGGVAYAIGSGYLSTYDVRDLADVRLVARIRLPVSFWGTMIEIFGDRALVTTPTCGNCRAGIVDIADPAAPRFVIEVAVPAHVWSWDEGVVIGDQVFLASPSGGLDVLDLAAAGAPGTASASPARPSPAFETIGAPFGVEIVGDVAYVWDHRGVHVVDAAAPGDPDDPPHVLARVATASTPYMLSIWESHAYVFEIGDAARAARLTVLDITQPAAPVVASTLELPGGARFAVAAGGRLYAVGDVLLVFDLADPARPRLTGRLALRDRVTGNFAKVRDDHAYISGSDGALWVADVSDPAAPRWAARRDMSECCTMQRVDGFSGRHAYVVVWETARVEILDVADPADPRPVGVIEAAGIVRGLDVADGLLWVVSDAGTRAYDLADAAAPRLVFDAPLPAALVRAAGDRLYTIGTTDGLGMWRVERGGGPGGRFTRPGGRGGASSVLYLPSISLGD